VDEFGDLAVLTILASDFISMSMLVRRDGETFSQLMIGLDLAIARAFVDDIFTDEVNVPPRKK